MKLGSWPEEIHESDDQKKRIQSAKSAKTTPSEVDRENQTGLFPGSGKEPYVTTLESCTCRDFVIRRLPCKHMYRLGIELGLLNETAEQGINKNISPSPTLLEQAVGELENLSDELQKEIKEFLRENLYHETDKFRILKDEQSDLLLNCLLFEPVSTSIFEKLQYYRRNQMFAILDKHQISGFKRNGKRDDLITWCIENIEDIWSIFQEVYVFRFSDYFRKARQSTYKYLLRKYDWNFGYEENEKEGFYEVIYPHGAVFEDLGNPFVCHFPDDKITKLLTLYGHNRCLNGFDVRKTRKKIVP